MPSFMHPIFVNLVKTQIPRNRVTKKYIPNTCSICLATIGVCVFRCADFGWRTFYFKEENMKKVLLVVIALVLIFNAVSCVRPQHNHQCSYELTEEVEGTCTSWGYLQYVCSICGREKREVIGEKPSHAFGEFITVEEPHHYEEGLKERYCSNCEYVEREYIKACGLSLYMQYADENSREELGMGLVASTPDQIGCGCEVVNEYSFSVPSEYMGHTVWAFLGFSYGPESPPYQLIYIPSSVEVISNLDGLEYLEEVHFDSYSKLTEIGAGTFSSTGIESISLPASVKVIGDHAFRNCINLKNIELSRSLETIGECAFYGCLSLENISIPASVTSISKWAFAGCTSLENFYVSKDNNRYMSKDGILYNKDQTHLIKYPEGKTDKSFAIPDSVEHIEGDAFSDYINELESVYIPNTVTNIDPFAFSGNNLTIYCEALEQPDGWEWSWSGQCTVVWGYKYE